MLDFAVICQTKNYGQRILPFFLYYKEQGCSKFIHFDDFSTNESKSIIEHYNEKYNLNIISLSTDQNDYWKINVNDANSYKSNPHFSYRICRSYNRGTKILRYQQFNGYIAFVDGDEFMTTGNDKTLKEYLNETKLPHLYVQSFDIQQDFTLDGFYPANDDTSFRWDYEARKNSPFWARGKSAILINYVPQIKQKGGANHTLYDYDENGKIITDFSIVPNHLDIRIHHFRVPNSYPSIKCIKDETLTNKCKKVKEKYGL